MFDIGTHIRELRKKSKMTTTELARRMGFTQSFISDIENNNKKCSMEHIFKLCEIFNVSLAEFFAEPSPDLPPELAELVDAAKKLPPEKLELAKAMIKAML